MIEAFMNNKERDKNYFRWIAHCSKIPESVSGKYNEEKGLYFKAESNVTPEIQVGMLEINTKKGIVKKPSFGIYNSPFELKIVYVNETMNNFLTDWAMSYDLMNNNQGCIASFDLFLLSDKDEPYYKFELHGVRLYNYKDNTIGLAYEYFIPSVYGNNTVFNELE